MLRIAVVEFNKSDHFCDCLNTSLWHKQIQHYIGSVSDRNALCCELLRWSLTNQIIFVIV
jgi:hypothetical protein